MAMFNSNLSKLPGLASIRGVFIIYFYGIHSSQPQVDYPSTKTQGFTKGLSEKGHVT